MLLLLLLLLHGRLLHGGKLLSLLSLLSLLPLLPLLPPLLLRRSNSLPRITVLLLPLFLLLLLLPLLPALRGRTGGGSSPRDLSAGRVEEIGVAGAGVGG